MNYSYEEVIELIDDKRLMWNYITSLRGPDSGDDMVKAFTTCILRGEVGKLDGMFGIDRIRAYKDVKAGEIAEGLLESQQHFQSHTRTGLASLLQFLIKKYPDKPEIPRLLNIMTGCLYSDRSLEYVKAARKFERLFEYEREPVIW